MWLRIFIVFVLLLSPGLVNADQDFISYEINRNVFIADYNSRYLFDPRNHLLFDALTEISEKYFGDTACVTLRFGLDSFVVGENIFHGRAPFYVGYSLRRFRNTLSKRVNEGFWSKTIYRQSVNIYITQPGFKTRDILEMVYYAWSHKTEIEAVQKPVFIKTDINDCCEKYVIDRMEAGVVINNFEFVPVLPQKKVREILLSTYAPVEEFLQKRVDDYDIKGRGSIVNAYLQNDSFFYYIIDSVNGNMEKLLLKSDERGRIESDGNNNDLIILKKTAWHYNRHNRTLTGPIKLPDIGYLAELEEPYLASSLRSRSDSELVITKKLIFDQYAMVYNIRQQIIYLDTVKLSENMKGWLKNREEEEEEQSKLSTSRYPWQKYYRKTSIDHTPIAMLAFAVISIAVVISISIKKYE